MFLAGARSLQSKKDWINELNVFPVPDGDTGTNMSMTIESAAKEVSALTDVNMKALAKAMSSGSLRGARGNSGVILSQLLRGFSKVIRDYDELNLTILAEAFQKATETAYKAVMKPKEGTILTVAKAFSDKAAELSESSAAGGMELETFLQQCLENAQVILAKTPEMLPVLKEAGVVDSGGQGLVQILQGAFDLFCGKETLEEEVEEPVKVEGYCVEYVLTLKENMDETGELELQNWLASQSIDKDAFVLKEENAVKVHLHTMTPGEILTRSLVLGELSKVRIEPLADGHHEYVVTKADRLRAEQIAAERKEKSSPRKDVGFISVSVGEGLSNIFKDLGVDYLIEGGQTMNPSTDDILRAVDQVNADTIFIFPNNKNIILAASQAQTMVRDKKLIVIPTRTIPQGITALINYMPDKSPEDNEEDMYQEIRRVQTCQMTYAVRDTHIDGKDIHEGDYMGVGDSGILSVGTDLKETAVDAVTQMVNEESELVSVYFGQDASEEDGEALCAALRDACPQVEVELNAGDQPVYYYIISVE